MFLDNLLSIIIFIPLIAAAILGLFLRGNDEAAQLNAKYVALAATLASLFASLFLLAGFDPDDTSGNDADLSAFSVRGTTVHLQSEPLDLARLPIEKPVGEMEIELEGWVLSRTEARLCALVAVQVV